MQTKICLQKIVTEEGTVASKVDLQMSLLTHFPSILFLYVSSTNLYVCGTRKKEKHLPSQHFTLESRSY